MKHVPRRCDVGIGLGSHDLSVAMIAVDLFHRRRRQGHQHAGRRHTAHRRLCGTRVFHPTTRPGRRAVGLYETGRGGLHTQTSVEARGFTTSTRRVRHPSSRSGREHCAEAVVGDNLPEERVCRFGDPVPTTRSLRQGRGWAPRSRGASGPATDPPTRCHAGVVRAVRRMSTAASAGAPRRRYAQVGVGPCGRGRSRPPARLKLGGTCHRVVRSRGGAGARRTGR